MEILVATHNLHKKEEIQQILGEKYKITSLTDYNIHERSDFSFFAPIIEEIIFRGIIQKGMINNGVKPRNAILVSAFIFGIVHFNPWQFIGAFLLGIVLGVVYFKTKSLLMSIFLHFFNNTIAAIMMKFCDTDSFAELLHLPNYLILFIGIVIFAVFYYLFMYKNRVYYRE